MTTVPRDKRLLLFLFLLAWVLRAVFVADYTEHHPLAQRPVIDEASYESWADEIAAGDWLGDEVFFQEPLYPYTLGAFYRAHATVSADRGPARRGAWRHVQALLGAVTVVGVWLLTRRLFGTGAAHLAGGLLALYRPLLFFPAYLLKPNLLLPLLALFAWWVFRRRGEDPDRPRLGGFLLAGLMAGAGALLRGNVLVLLPFVVGLPLLRRGWFRRAAMLEATAALLGILAVLAPVALRNQAVGGVFALTTAGAGTNLYGGNSLANRYGVATELSFVRGIPKYELADWTREAERRLGHELDAGEVSAFWMGETFASFRAEPLAHARILLNKLRLALGRYEVPDNHHLDWDASYLGFGGLPFPGFEWLGSLGLAGLFLLLVNRRARDARAATELGGAFVLYLGTIVLTVMSMRARLPLVILLAPFAGSFLLQAPGVVGRGLRRLLRAESVPGAAPRGWWISLGAALVLVFVPVFSAGEREQDLDVRELNHASYLLALGSLAEAQEVAAALALRYPETPRVQILEAEVEFHRARALAAAGAGVDEREPLLDRALGRLRDVVRGDVAGARERFRARKLAGLIQLDLEAAEAATRHLRAAFEFDPEDPMVRLGLANALYLRAIERAPGAETRAWLEESERLLTGLADEAGVEDLHQERLRLVRTELLR